MRRSAWSMALTFLLIALAGCGGFQAKKEIAAEIDAAAGAATGEIIQAAAGQIPREQALDVLARNLGLFGCLAATKTTNPFAFYLGPNRVLVNGEYAGLLDRAALLAGETWNRARTASVAWLNAAIHRQDAVVLAIQDALHGRAPPK